MQIQKNGRKAIVGLLLACVLMGTAYLLHAKVAVDEGNGTAVIRGTVRSEEGTPLYGIFVRTTGVMKNETTYVYTDEKGAYEFPPLPVGAYQVSVGTAWKKPVQLTASGAAQDFSVELGPGLVNQVTGLSLLKAIPGDDAEKQHFEQDCVACHSTTRMFQHAPSTPDGWDVIVKRMMVHLDESDWYPPAVLNADNPLHDRYKEEYSPARMRALVEFLKKNITPTTMNDYAASALVRPTGEAARAVFTEWQLPPGTGNASDVLADPDGIFWFVAGGNSVGRLDPRTGEAQTWKAPGVPSNSRFHDMEIDEHGVVWITASMLDKVVEFDTHTHQFTSWDTGGTGEGWTYPAGADEGHRTTYPHTGAFDSAHNYWVTTMGGKDSGVLKIDASTGAIKKFELPPTSKWAYDYGLAVDKNDNVWFCEHQQNKIGRIDKNGKLTEYPVPTPFDLPRRIQADSQGRVWFTESGVPAHIAMLDPATGKITEYDYGIPAGYAYWIKIDKHDKIWFNSPEPGNMIGKFDPDTKKFTLITFPQVDSHSINAHIDNRADPVAVLYSKPGQSVISRMYLRP